MELAPSKKFIKRISIIFGALIIIFVASFFVNKKETVTFPENSGLSVGKLKKATVEDLISKDSDQDGISDWEENLWGTDPNNKVSNSSGVSDKEYIDNKKKALQIQ